jgi:hypothetical protein
MSQENVELGSAREIRLEGADLWTLHDGLICASTTAARPT